jgi:MFS family permease
MLGTLIFAGSIALLALGFVKAPDWGWTGWQTIAALSAAVAGLFGFVERSRVHHTPVLELPLLRVRRFAGAVGAALLFSAGFGAMLLAGVLFLTGVWEYSVLRAGLALTPGPLMAAASAVPAGRLAPRLGEQRLAAIGCLLFAAGTGWWALRIGSPRAYVSELLPGMVLTGIGVGLTLASVSNAAVSALPPERFATGAAVLSMGRQLGIVLGVAILIAIYGKPAAADAVAHFHHGWWFMTATAAAGALAALAIGKRQTLE